MITKSSAEAQNQFGRLLDTVQREPVAITRHGRTAAFIVSPSDMQELIGAKSRRRNAVRAFEEWAETARMHTKPAAAELTDEMINRLVHELR